VRSSDDFIAALDHEVAYLLDENDLRVSIKEEGVRDQLTLVPLRVEHPDADAVTLLAAPDGSSRCASTYAHLGLTPREVVYSLATDDREFRQRIGQVLAIGQRDHRDIAEDEYAALQSLVLPAEIIIGFTPDAGVDLTISRAIDYRVGGIHVDPPTQWRDAAKHDVQLNAALDECLRRGRLNEDRALYFAGTITPADAEAMGASSFMDVRAGELLAFFARRSNANAVNAGIRGLLAGRVGSISKTDRVQLAVEAALRPYRSELPQGQVDGARRALLYIYLMDELLDAEDWLAHLGRDPADLADDALAEVELGQRGPAALALLVLAAYWLTKHRCVRPATRGQSETDRRGLPALMRAVVSSKHGIRQLHRAIVDGRRGAHPQRVRPDGTPMVNAAGEYLVVEEQWLRETWADERSGSSHSGTGATGTGSVSPQGELNLCRERLERAVQEVGACVRQLRVPIDETTGQPLVMTYGLPALYVDRLNQVLTGATGALNHYRHIHEERGTEPVLELEFADESDQGAEAEDAS
jgi:hypothetical protein